MIAALYVDPKGPYPLIPGVDCWDAARDARGYLGPWPVVAHPPCGPWGSLAHRCKHQDRSLAVTALAHVRWWGGVLEHPYSSRLWTESGVPRDGTPDAYGGWALRVRQHDWGHRAPKDTLIYVSGLAHGSAVAVPGPRDGPTTAVERMGKLERRLTPPAFADWLVGLARRCEGVPW